MTQRNPLGIREAIFRHLPTSKLALIHHSGDCHYTGYVINEQTGLIDQTEEVSGYVGEWATAPEYEQAHIEKKVVR